MGTLNFSLSSRSTQNISSLGMRPRVVIRRCFCPKRCFYQAYNGVINPANAAVHRQDSEAFLYPIHDEELPRHPRQIRRQTLHESGDLPARSYCAMTPLSVTAESKERASKSPIKLWSAQNINSGELMFPGTQSEDRKFAPIMLLTTRAFTEVGGGARYQVPGSDFP